MKKLINIIISTFFAVAIMAQDNDLWTRANDAYTAAHYDEAINLYGQMLNQKPAAEIYYNLGNAYYRIGEISQCILSYERALRLYPNYDDAKNNLNFVQKQIVDNIEDTNTFFLIKLAANFRNSLREDTWKNLSIIAFLLTLLGFNFYFFGNTLNVRKTAFYVAIIALFTTIIGISCAASLHQRDTEQNEAIITQGIVNVKASPDKSGTDLFTLHEGTKVTITEVIGNWGKIEVGNNVGWILLNNLERI